MSVRGCRGGQWPPLRSQLTFAKLTKHSVPYKIILHFAFCIIKKERPKPFLFYGLFFGFFLDVLDLLNGGSNCLFLLQNQPGGDTCAGSQHDHSNCHDQTDGLAVRLLLGFGCAGGLGGIGSTDGFRCLGGSGEVRGLGQLGCVRCRGPLCGSGCLSLI